MTIEELNNANRDMDIHSVCAIYCRYANPQCRIINDISNGCLIYEDDYFTMPRALKCLNVLSFKCLSPYKSGDEPGKWKIWVV